MGCCAGLLLLLLLSSSFLSDFSHAGRVIPHDHLLKAATSPPQPQLEGKGAVEASRAVIGSKPPRCDRRCGYCGSGGRCEAVQVPVAPQTRPVKTRTAPYSSAGKHFQAAKAADDFFSNYKPMSWKCKCGDFFFNP